MFLLNTIYIILGRFYEEVGQLTSSLQSFNSANQISSDDTLDVGQILIWTTCSYVPPWTSLFDDLNG